MHIYAPMLMCNGDYVEEWLEWEILETNGETHVMRGDIHVLHIYDYIVSFKHFFLIKMNNINFSLTLQMTMNKFILFNLEAIKKWVAMHDEMRRKQNEDT